MARRCDLFVCDSESAFDGGVHCRIRCHAPQNFQRIPIYMRLEKLGLRCVTLFFCAELLVVPLAAQSESAAPRALTTVDYARAERFMPYNVAPLVFHTLRARPTWVTSGDNDERFWYSITVATGVEFVLFDA